MELESHFLDKALLNNIKSNIIRVLSDTVVMWVFYFKKNNENKILLGGGKTVYVPIETHSPIKHTPLFEE